MSPQTGIARKTVLVVDDSTAVLLLVATILKEGPFETLQATGAAEAMRIAAQNRIDLLITDVEMPEMGGGELLAALKASGAVTHCLLVSGSPMEALRDTYYFDSQVGFLAKPFGPERLLRAIDELLQS